MVKPAGIGAGTREPASETQTQGTFRELPAGLRHLSLALPEEVVGPRHHAQGGTRKPPRERVDPPVLHGCPERDMGTERPPANRRATSAIRMAQSRGWSLLPPCREWA